MMRASLTHHSHTGTTDEVEQWARSGHDKAPNRSGFSENIQTVQAGGLFGGFITLARAVETPERGVNMS